MRSALSLVVALGACGFSATPASNQAPQLDAAVGGGTMIDAPVVTPPAAFCDPNDLSIIVCYEFENSPSDGSSHHLGAMADHVTYMPGMVGMAMKFAQDSNADVNDNTAFDVSALTIEAWIKPSELPQNGEPAANIVDVNNQYALQVESNGDLVCQVVGGKPMTSPAAVTKDQWTHVACTYVSTTGTTALYVNGAPHGSVSGGGPLATGGNTGLSISANNPRPPGPGVTAEQQPPSRDRLIGLIDQLRLTSAARTPAQICADAGLSKCP
jgi:concanavalin A-like lectin/glucanase superfamily protein